MEIALIVEKFPERIDKIREEEKEMGSTFFPPNYIPARFCSKTVEAKDGRKVKVPTIDDVVKYVKGKKYIGGLFAGATCQNPFVICE